MKDGVQFGPEKSGSGKINASEDEETMELESYAGVYQCFASNDLGTAMTQTVAVIVERESHSRDQENRSGFG